MILLFLDVSIITFTPGGLFLTDSSFQQPQALSVLP